MAGEKKVVNEERTLEAKWGKKTVKSMGWTGIPNLLIERQQALSISPLELNILIIMMKHWWESDRMPFPSKKIIAEIINRDGSTVQRAIRNMEKNGLLERIKRGNGYGGQGSNEYNLSGLISKLQVLAEEEENRQDTQRKAEGRRRRGVTSSVKEGVSN